MVFGSGDCAEKSKGRLSLHQEGDDGCLELFLESLLTGWQSSGHTMFGFNCSSAGVFAVGRWVTFDAEAFYQFGSTNLDNGRQGLTVLAVGASGGCSNIFSLAYHFSFLSPSLWNEWMDTLWF